MCLTECSLTAIDRTFVALLCFYAFYVQPPLVGEIKLIIILNTTQKWRIEMCKPRSVRSAVAVLRRLLDWQTFHTVFPGVWSWIRQHTCHHCEHTPNCIDPSSSCWRWPWVTEKWHRGHLRSRTWPAWISSCHRWTRLSPILYWPAECWSTHNSAGNRATLLE